MRRVLPHLVRFILLVAGASFLAGCEFDPHTHVHADSQPQSVFSDGVWWHALKINGTEDEYFWVPAEIDDVGHAAGNWRTKSVDLLVNGTIWRLTKTDDGQVLYEGWITPDVNISPGTFFGWFVVGLLALGSLIFAFSSQLRLKEALASAQKAENDLQALKNRDTERENSYQRQLLEFNEAQKELQAAQIAHSDEVDKLERDQRAHALAVRRRTLDLSNLTEEEYRRQSAAIRARMFRGSGRSDEVFVKYVLDPKRGDDGQWGVAFEWEMLLDRPHLPTVIIERNGREMKRETGQAKGDATSVVKSGRRSVFSFRVVDGRREYPNPFTVEIVAPPFEAWQPKPAKARVPSKRAIQRKRMAWIEEQKEMARSYENDPDRLRDKFARIEQEAMEKFGEAE